METWTDTMEPGANPPVDIFPFLKFLPEKLFAKWKTMALKAGAVMDGWRAAVIGGKG
jgi:hypothetical protein